MKLSMLSAIAKGITSLRRSTPNKATLFLASSLPKKCEASAAFVVLIPRGGWLFFCLLLGSATSACAQSKNFTAKNIAPRQEAVWRIDGQRVVTQYRHADGRRAIQTNAYQIVRGAMEVRP